jgi:hypothetical protein
MIRTVLPLTNATRARWYCFTSPAFDTVDRDILASILQRLFGIQGPALDWFANFSSYKRPVTVGIRR